MKLPKSIKAVFLFFLVFAFLVGAYPRYPAHAHPVLSLSGVQVTNVRDGSFAVSWTTDSPSDGAVDWGISTPPGNSVTDPVVATTTHYVTISGLTSSTKYYFQIRSGGVTDNNHGSFYVVNTGPTLGIPTPGKTVWGYVYQSDGVTPVANAIVYIQLQDANGTGSSGLSQWASARSDTNGVWFFDLVNLRTADSSAYYSFSDGVDTLRIAWIGGINGSAGSMPDNPQTYLAPVTYPAQIDQSLSPTNKQIFLPIIVRPK